MTFTVTSNSFKDGDTLPKDFILSADFGFGCAGGNKSPPPEVVGRAHRHKKFRADRLWFLALAGREHPGNSERTCRGRRQ